MEKQIHSLFQKFGIASLSNDIKIQFQIFIIFNYRRSAMKKSSPLKNTISRRHFFKTGSITATGLLFSLAIDKEARSQEDREGKETPIQAYRTLGRTGFKASDISMGCTRAREANVYRYAYDRGINYFDTAESYVSGNAEKYLGQALKFMDRKKIFITTKIHISHDESEASILERFSKCQARMQTDYIDALYMHSVKDVTLLNHAGFHSAVKKLKSDGRVRFCGVSSHGPRKKEQDSMEKVLTAAAEDGRFDLMLLIYSFLNNKAGDNILKACKKNNVGTTAMKTTPGVLAVEMFDKDNLTEEQERIIQHLQNRGYTKERALKKLEKEIEDEREETKGAQPFIEKHRIKTAVELRKTSIQWILSNPLMNTVCVSFMDFDLVDRMVEISGSKLSEIGRDYLDTYSKRHNRHYCRHACNLCQVDCPYQLPISTIMRYAYYYDMQKREKEAMLKYARLGNRNASLCHNCHAPCLTNCPHQINIPWQLSKAHSLLTLS
jgi:predicted aldo/keto reductase-like oxidoreductase